jgi:integrase
MTPGAAGTVEQKRAVRWVWPLNLARYDQAPTLTAEEQTAIVNIFSGSRRYEFAGNRWRGKLNHLLTLILDALKLTGASRPIKGGVVSVLLNAMRFRNSSYWGWKEEDWEEVLRPSSRMRSRVRGYRVEARSHLLALAVLLRRIQDPRSCGYFDRILLANRVFGKANVAKSTDRVLRMLKQWGFSDHLNWFRTLTGLCEAMVLNRSPLLEDLTTEVVQDVHGHSAMVQRKWCVQRLSCALVELGLIDRAIGHGYAKPRGGRPNDLTVGIAPQWVLAVQRWRNTSTLSPKGRAGVFYNLLKIGRWVTTTFPDEASPELWTRETAARCVAEICRMRVGEWTNQVQVQTKPEKRLTPRAVNGHLYAVRAFFRDCQEWEWIPARFDPARYLRTPTSVRRLIGPDPRIVGDDNWAKLVWAGLNLTEPDLPCTEHGRFLYPFQMLRALTMVWLFAGLRCDEIQRLRLGSIRWKNFEEGETPGAGKQTCLLHVPVNKTSTAFVKPVDSIVGREIETWEKIRPEQPAMLDAKTGELVHFLFVHRTHRVSNRYLNHTLIPALCKKAGVPRRDARGAITSHRARATIASQLYNAREPLSLFELQQWMGHRNPESTQSYAKISPTKLARSYDAAGYFERNLRTIEVLVDHEAVRKGLAEGTPWKYYDLGHGYCTYDFFDQCPHRMACAKCAFYQPKESTGAALLEGKNNLLRMRQEIPLGESEVAALDDGVSALESLLHRLANVPTPAGPTPRQLRDETQIQIQPARGSD